MFTQGLVLIHSRHYGTVRTSLDYDELVINQGQPSGFYNTAKFTTYCGRNNARARI